MASWIRHAVGVALVLWCAGAGAAVRVRAATLTIPGVAMTDVRVDAALRADGRPELKLEAGKVSIAALGWHGVALSLDGTPQRAGNNAWKFTGHVATRNAPGGALANADVTVTYDPDGGTLDVNLAQGKSGVQALMPLDQTSHVQLTLAALPLAWLRGVLESAWRGGRLNGGTLAGSVALDLGGAGTRASGRVVVAGANLDSKAGNIAAQKLGAAGIFRLETGLASATLMFDGTLDGGQLLLGPLFARLPAHQANLHVAARIGLGGTSIDSLDFDDGDALRVAGKLAFDRNGNLEKLDLTRFAATFPAAYTRYGTTLVQGLTGFANLATSGSVVGSMALAAGGPRAFSLSAENLSFDSHGDSLAVAGVNGSVDWQAGTSRPPTTLAWKSLAMYRIAFGPGKLGLEDRAGALTLRAPANVAVLGGAFQLNHLAWRPDASKAQRLAAGFSVTDVDLPKLCKAFGWPVFAGKLGGAVPDVTYRGNDVVFDGGLSLNVFGGSISVTNLAMQHPFGSTPELAADIDMDHLDLAALTGVFGFGRITGNLDGDIHDLRLVDWKPVSFRAGFTSAGGSISQNAINGLAQLGGGGIAGGLQGIALRVFKTFHYARLGLSCVLAHGVCTMAGITPDPDPDGDGYTIVEGSGLPRITVIGHTRAVDWPTLVSRLKAATEGNGPVIQ